MSFDAKPNRRVRYFMKALAAERAAKKAAKNGRYTRSAVLWRLTGGKRVWIKSYERAPLE